MILVLIIFLVLSFLLSGIESAVLSVSRVRLRHAADTGDWRAERLLRMMKDRDALLGAVTVANHLFNLGAFLIITRYLIAALGSWGYAAGFLLALPVFLIGLEVVPKIIFRRYPFRLLRHLFPLVQVIGWFRGPLKAMRGIRESGPADETGEYAGSDDLKALAGNLAAQRILPKAAATLIVRVLDLKRIKTGDLMVPLSEITGVPSDMSVRTAQQMARDNSFAALPVIGEGGRFDGILELVNLPASLPGDKSVRQFMRPIEESLAGESAVRTLQRLRKRGRTLAIVKEGSSGEAVGIVTEEDLLAPLLGRSGPSA